VVEDMRYICLSDLHLGQDGSDGSGQCSLLSSNQKGGARDQFIDKCREFAGKDKAVLVLVGDALDFSLADPSFCLHELDSLICDLNCIGKVEYVAGNHDHHIWTANCEAAFWHRYTPPGTTIYKPTNLTGDYCQIADYKFGPTNVKIAYPILKHETLAGPTLIFTHGHLQGGMYNLLSRILKPYILGQYSASEASATVNTPIIELIYWQLGQIGCQMGADGLIEATYTDLLKGKDALALQLVDRIVDELFPDGLVKGIPDSWERAALKWVGKRLVKLWASSSGKIVSSDRYKDREKTRVLISEWSLIEPIVWTAPSPFIYITGHTHIKDTWSEGVDKFYNLGSWLIEPEHPTPDAVALFISDEEGHLRVEPQLF